MIISKKLYYRLIILFINRIINLATIKPAALVKANINICLRKITLLQYILELNNAKRSDLRNDINDVNLQIKNLKRRFKILITVTLQQLTTTKYIINNIRNRNEPAEYVQLILRHVKTAGFDITYNQLSWAYQNLAPALRLNIDPLSEYISIKKFVRILKLKKKAWFDIYSR